MGSDSLTDIMQAILQFRDKRNWSQFHNPKDLAISLSLEAAELLELMQWRSGEELSTYLEQNRNRVGEELSDILYCTLLMAHDLNINLAKAFREKMAANELKYPVNKARDSSRKYTDFEPNDGNG